MNEPDGKNHNVSDFMTFRVVNPESVIWGSEVSGCIDEIRNQVDKSEIFDPRKVIGGLNGPSNVLQNSVIH